MKDDRQTNGQMEKLIALPSHMCGIITAPKNNNDIHDQVWLVVEIVRHLIILFMVIG